MKAALIGSNGLIGSRVVETFQLTDGPSCVAIEQRAADLTLASRFAIDVRVAALDEVDSLTRAFAGCSLAVHAEAVPAAQRPRRIATLTLAAARANIRRLVLISLSHHSDLQPEEATLAMATEAVQETERSFLSDCRKLGLAGHVIRPGVVYGPRSLLIAAMAAELRDQRAWVIGGGTAVMPAVYIDNVVEAIRLCLRTKSGTGEVIELTDPEAVTWREFYNHMARELDFSGSRIRHVSVAGAPNGAPDGLERIRLQQAAAPRPGNATSLIPGYAPVVALPEGIRRSCAWWRFTQGEWSAAA